MSAVYDPALSDAISRLRFRLGDTDTTDPDYQDETYQAQLDAYEGDEGKAVLPLVRGLVAMYSRKATNYQAGTVREEYADRLRLLEGLQASILSQTSTGFMVITPTVGSVCSEFG